MALERKESSAAVRLDVSADPGRESLDELEDQDLRVVCLRPCGFVGKCRPVTRRGLPGSFPFHLRTALLRPGRQYALSERDGRPGQDELRAAGASGPYRQRLSGLAGILRRVRRDLGALKTLKTD